MQKPQPAKKEKSPSTAALIGAMSPGSGQLWVGYLGRGIIAFVTSFLCGFGYFWGIYDAYKLAERANRGEIPSNDRYVFHAIVTMPLVVVVIVLAIAGGVIWHYSYLFERYFAMLESI